MASWDSRIETGVDAAIGAYLKAQKERAAEPLPIDLEIVVLATGSIEIVEREMIPEAGLDIIGEKFRIYLRSNFKDRPGEAIRQRFSLAHEIAHTFFYNKKNGTWKPMKGSPRGLDLEHACHEAASRLLVPERYLPTALEGDQIDARYLVECCDRFGVSLEVILRRFERHPGLDSSHVSFVTCRSGKMEYANHPIWLRDLLPKRAGGSLQKWFRSSDVSLIDWFTEAGFEIENLPDGSFIGSRKSQMLAVKKFRINKVTDLYEIRGNLQLGKEEVRARLVGA